MTVVPPPPKRMKLRYSGTCRGCGTTLPAGQQAVYHPATKQVECIRCAAQAPAQRSEVDGVGPDTAAEDNPTTRVPDAVEPGAAGASARREHERRVAKRQARIQAAHPRLGRFILAVSDEPQSTTAWARGALGEERLGQRLDQLRDRGVLMLHDRRIPGSRANLDHIAISPAGVFVIDAKRYQGRPRLRIEGGLIRPRTETLMVGGRDCTKLVTGITKQVALVQTALNRLEIPDVRVAGMLCFIDADWPLIGGSFHINGIQVLWPKLAAERICAGDLIDADTMQTMHHHLASAFPIA